MQSTARLSAQTAINKRRHTDAPPSSLTATPAPYDDKSYLAYSIRSRTVLIVLIVIRLLAALFSPIADCDETYNYWEPMHYLLYSFGFQTWEYSPQYALRSYAYLYPYALVAKLAATFFSFLNRTLGFLHAYSPKILVFYTVRVTLAFITASAETLLFRGVQHRFGAFVALLLFVFLASSPGMFRSSVEFLPSTFSMVLLIIALWAWIENHLFLTVFCVAVAALLGWVFSAILAAPMAIDILLRRDGFKLFLKFATVSGLAVIATMVPIDTYHFGVLTVAPLNHILYNVFPKEGAGSHLFGEESWTFYAKNLVLNCNLPALFYVSFPLLLLIGCILRLPEYNGAALNDRLRFLSGSYIANAVFILQPHKEERFLVPSYPCIALVAAVGTNDLLKLLDAILSLRSHSFARQSRRVVFRLVCIPILAFSALLGLSRIAVQVKSFHAPFSIYEQLSTVELRNGIGPRNSPPEFLRDNMEVNICIGSEWHRFPTSFFLPHKRFRVRFVFSGFDGLLPKPFQETRNGTRIIPSGMNEFNKADPYQFFNWSTESGCHYFVNLEFSHRADDSPWRRPDFPVPKEARYVVFQEPFLDREESHGGFRAFYLPGFRDKLVNAEYQLIRNIRLLPFADLSAQTFDTS